MCESLKQNKHPYITGGDSATGISHIKSKTPNQDHHIIISEDHYTILCVADGHGSKIHFRSDIGSKIATEITAELLISFVEDTYQKQSKEPFHERINRLRKNIISHWRDRINQHMKTHPIEIKKVIHENHIINDEDVIKQVTNENLLLDDKDSFVLSALDFKSILENPLKAYGTTLLAVLLFDEGIVCIQIGDGDIRFIDQRQMIKIMEDEHELFANETYSLSSIDAYEHLNIVYTNFLPEFVFLSTDGIKNSFTVESDFELLGFELLKECVQNPEELNKSLKTLLNNFAEKGSGDDCTLCYAININNLKKENNTWD